MSNRLELIRRKPSKIIYRGAKRILLKNPTMMQYDREFRTCFLEIDAKKIFGNMHGRFPSV